MAHYSRRLALVVLAGGSLAACGKLAQSKLNPLNWFGRSRRTTARIAPEVLAENPDGRALVQEVLNLTIEATPRGAIIRATGLPAVQGHYDAELVPFEGEGSDPSILVYLFRIAGPWGDGRVSTQASREVVVATHLTNRQLDGVRQIRVEGELNSRVLSR